MNSKGIRKTLISAFILLFILVGGGITYIYFTDRSSKPTLQQTSPVATVQESQIKPPKTSPNAQEQAAVMSFNSPVARGQQASLYVETNPYSVCNIKAVYNNIPSKAAGLTAQTADDFGDVNWNWTVDKTAPLGTWPVTVTCTSNKKSAVVIGNLQVTAK